MPRPASAEPGARILTREEVEDNFLYRFLRQLEAGFSMPKLLDPPGTSWDARILCGPNNFFRLVDGKGGPEGVLFRRLRAEEECEHEAITVEDSLVSPGRFCKETMDTGVVSELIEDLEEAGLWEMVSRAGYGDTRGPLIAVRAAKHPGKPGAKRLEVFVELSDLHGAEGNVGRCLEVAGLCWRRARGG